MAKRFTDTEKWSDPWFRKLHPKMKLFFSFLCDRCDNAGVWKPDLELAGVFIGEQIDAEESLLALKGRVSRLPNGDWFVNKFIAFQYGELVEKCLPHKKVLGLLKEHGIDPTTLSIGYPKGSDTLKEEDKEEDGKRKKGEVQEGFGFVLKTLRNEIGKHFDQAEPWPYSDESMLAEIARRPKAMDEWLEINRYRKTPSQYHRQTVKTLLENWTGELSKARKADRAQPAAGKGNEWNDSL